jgi:MFS family permease
MVTATGSRLADEAAAVAVVLHVVARTGDPRLAGLVVAAFALPTLVTGPLLGAVLDRLRTPRPLFLANQAVLAAALAGILLLAGRAPGWALITLGLLAGLTAPVLTGGYSALVPRLPNNRGLARTNALDAASYDIAGLGGPAAVAAIASLAGAGSALAAAAALAAAGVVLVAIAPMPGPTANLAAKRSERSPAGATVAPTTDPGPLLNSDPPTAGSGPLSNSVLPNAGPGPLSNSDLPSAGAELRLDSDSTLRDRGPFFSEVRNGLALLWRVRTLRATTAATTLGHAAQGLLPVTFPLLAIHFGHPAAHGAWFLTALSAGSLAGALASVRLLARRPPVPVLAASLATLGLALVGVAAAPTLPIALVVAAVGGVATGPMLAATLAVRQQSVPIGRYGQVVATAASIKVGAYALGAAATGPVLTWLPPRGVLLLVGAVQFAALPLLLGARAPQPRSVDPNTPRSRSSANPEKSPRVPA